MSALRRSAVALGLAALVAAPVVAAIGADSPLELIGAAGLGLAAAVDKVGWVLVPQLVLAVAVLALALQQLALRAAGLHPDRSPGWLDAAIESALLLGMLGTLAGMVNGFVGLSPEELEPGPLVHSLGVALRSSFVGFLIALVGVWARVRPAATDAEPDGAAAA